MHRTIRPGGPANHDDPRVDVLRRFTDMVNDFHPGSPGRPGQAPLFPNPPGGDNPDGGRTGPSPLPGFTRTTFRATPFGNATVTIHTIGGAPGGRGGPLGFDAYVFQPPLPQPRGQACIHNSTNMAFSIFTDFMNGPPGATDPNNPQARQGRMPPGPFDQILQNVMAAMLGQPPGGVHGDAVYSQEALDRIISQLMEAHPLGSRAPPPASAEAIEKLSKRKVQIEDLGSDGKAECTICIEELHVGDEVTVLPCKHWFHGECVTLWLKEHNTCPICRTPIEADRGRDPQLQQHGQTEGQQQGPQPGQPGFQQQPRPQQGSSAPNPWSSDNAARFHGNNQGQQQYGAATQGGSRDSAPPGSGSSPRSARYDRLFRTPSSNEERLNAIRNLAGANYRPSPSRTSSSSQHQQPGSAPQRRNSHSPPPEQATRISRVRSLEFWSRNPYGGDAGAQPPVSGYDADAYGRRERDSREGGEARGGGGPLSWLRDQWSRHSGSGGGGGSGDGSGSGDARQP